MLGPAELAAHHGVYRRVAGIVIAWVEYNGAGVRVLHVPWDGLVVKRKAVRTTRVEAAFLLRGRRNVAGGGRVAELNVYRMSAQPALRECHRRVYIPQLYYISRPESVARRNQENKWSHSSGPPSRERCRGHTGRRWSRASWPLSTPTHRTCKCPTGVLSDSRRRPVPIPQVRATTHGFRFHY